jgi:pyruvate dehydrogenase E2 component (dihydrolipoamide acetyltransferase)
MAEYIVMPKLGFDMREAVLNNWLKEVGDTINKGDVVAEIESDKATLELEAHVSGTLLKLLAEPGEVMAIGANLAIVGEEGEEIGDLDSDDAPAKKEAEPDAATEKEAEPDAATEKEAETDAEKDEGAKSDEEATPAAEGDYPAGVKATPVARRIAGEHEVDLTAVTPSGPDGRIRKADVEAFLESGKTAAPTAPKVEPTAAPSGLDSEEIPASRLRQAIGRRMVESKTTIPHFYVTSSIDMAAVLELRKKVKALLPEESKVSVNDMIVKAAALALRDFPNINASFGGDKIIRHKRINVGTAVAVEGGLLTVVQKETDSSSLSKIAADNKAMIARARDNKIKPEDVQGSTFTVSNLGPFDVDDFVAIINPPEAAILAVSSAKQVPVVVDGEIKIGLRMNATISADHRVTDGAEAAQFMQRFKQILEEPMRLLV